MNKLERCVTFLDYANINCGFEQYGAKADYGDLIEYMGIGRFCMETHVFVPIDPRIPYGRDAEIENLWKAGCLVHSKAGVPAGDSYRCDFDIEMTLEIMRTVELGKPDIVVIGTGDRNFIPVVLELRRRGIRVEIAAFSGVNAARDLVLKASGFVDLGIYLDEWKQTHVLQRDTSVMTEPEEYTESPEQDDCHD
jgi:uncharacterized LabA/DUF88 family protein